jgi:hypothetical protein
MLANASLTDVSTAKKWAAKTKYEGFIALQEVTRSKVCYWEEGFNRSAVALRPPL